MSTKASVTTVTRVFTEAEVKAALDIPADEKLTYLNGRTVETTKTRRQNLRGERTFEMELTVQTKRTGS